MSHRYAGGGFQADVQQPLMWERVSWRQGDGRYVFEVMEGGLHGRLASPMGTSLTLPMVAWEGLLDALAAARKTRTRAERGFPARSGARWYEGEAAELVAAFRAGRTIRELARAHNRSEFAVEAQLDRAGLWDRVARQPVASRQDLVRSQQSVGASGQRPAAADPGIPLRQDQD
jgi:hypothetical protein